MKKKQQSKVDGWINLKTRHVAFWLSNEERLYKLCKTYKAKPQPFIELRDYLKDFCQITKTDTHLNLWDDEIDTHSLDTALRGLR